MPANDPASVSIGGAALVTLSADAGAGPGLISADLVPGRGMMLLRLRADLPGLSETDLVVCPPLEEAVRRLEDPQDLHGNATFAFGGALLLPFANRITGALSLDGRTILAASPYGALTLPANWGGKAPGAARYAMHGLILRSAFDIVEQTSSRVRAVRVSEDFGDAWPGRFDIEVTAELTRLAFRLEVEVRNTSDHAAPMGIGWHPYFTIPSGDRTQARLWIRGSGRAQIGDYDQVLPTGVVEPVRGTAHDFSGPGGAALNRIYLDDCFTGLDPSDDGTVDLIDPLSAYALRVTAATPPVNAFQVYAPPEEAFVVIEPQYNLADPFAPIWSGRDNGMVHLPPGQVTRYAVSVEPVCPL